MAVTGVGSTTGTGTQTEVKTDNNVLLSQDYTTFIKLLTSQLKNQDPLSPMDSSQFTQQLVQFSGVEQQIAANKKLQSIIDMQSAGAAQQALGYLGKIGEVKGNQIPLVSGVAAFSYDLSTVADNNKIEILDAAGNVVRTVDGSTSVGKHVVTWDGTNDAGDELADGLYTIKVSPTRIDNTKVEVATTVYGVISSVSTGADGTVQLSMTYLQGAPSDIMSVNSSLSGVTNNLPSNDNGEDEGEEEAPAA